MKIQSLTLLALITLSTALLPGCVSAVFTGGYYYDSAASENTDTQNIEVGSFDSIRVRGEFVIEYTAGSGYSASVEAPVDKLQYIHIAVEDGVLTATTEHDHYGGPNKTPVLYLSAPMLKAVAVEGTAVFTDADTIRSDSFSLNVAGTAVVELPLEVSELEVAVAGTSTLQLSGSADSANITIAGTSTMDAFDLETRNTRVSIDGMGFCSISCSETLDVSIDGMGSLEYRGDPELRQSISGLGTVEKE